MPSFFKIGNTTIDFDLIAAVADPDEDNAIKVTLLSGGHVQIKSKGKTAAKAAHELLLEALSERGKPAQKA